MADRPRWGKAGVRLTDQQITQRSRAATAERNKRDIARTADNRIAYRLWRAGQLQPYLITQALNARGLHGPQVDTECGAAEPDVDLWEAGQLYPTWQQVLLLAALCGTTPRFLCTRRDVIPLNHTTLRFHGHTDDGPPTVWTFQPQAVAATVSTAPTDMPEEAPDA